MNTILEVNGLSKQFREIRAVDDLSFAVNKGEVYGFLGQNGAGKSTTIRMLLTLVRPTAGTIHILGKDLKHSRTDILRSVGAIIERPDLYKYLTAFENLKIMAKLSGSNPDRTALTRQLDLVGLADRAHSKVRTFSQGMKQRLGIACALMHDPELIILDEPTNGLDPQGIADMRNLILHLGRNEGKTILVSSHLLSEIELIADSMLIIDRGRKITEGTVSGLLNPADSMVRVSSTNDEQTLTMIKSSSWNQFLVPDEKKIMLHMDRNAVPELNRQLVGWGVEVLSLETKYSLEDFFLSLTTANQHVAAYKN